MPESDVTENLNTLIWNLDWKNKNELFSFCLFALKDIYAIYYVATIFQIY